LHNSTNKKYKSNKGTAARSSTWHWTAHTRQRVLSEDQPWRQAQQLTDSDVSAWKRISINHVPQCKRFSNVVIVQSTTIKYLIVKVCITSQSGSF